MGERPGGGCQRRRHGGAPCYRWALEDLNEVEVVTRAADGQAAIAAVAQHQPDIVLTDLRMPGVGGLEATARISLESPDVAVVVLTMDSEEESVFAAFVRRYPRLPAQGGRR